MSASQTATVLSEIASLLLLLHETYLRDASEWREILSALMTFLHDAKLSDLVSVLQVERLRRKVMPTQPASSSKSPKIVMGYEMFYEWLREVSALVYPYSGENGRRRSLHSLLTQYIIPLATGPETSINNASGENTLDGKNDGALFPIHAATLDAMIEYSDFMHLLYATSCQIEDTRLTPISHAWQSAQQVGLTTQNLVSMLTRTGAVPTMATMEQITKLQPPNDKKQIISFGRFLRILESIAGLIGHEDLQSLAYDDPIQAQAMAVLASMAESCLSTSFSSFVAHNQARQSKAELTIGGDRTEFSRRGSATGSISSFSLLAMCRDSGLLQLPNSSLASILTSLDSHGSKNASADVWINERTIPRVLFELTEQATRLDSKHIMSLIGVSTKGRYALYFAKALPGALFSTPISMPALLETLYQPDVIRRLSSTTGTHSTMDFLMKVCNECKQNDPPSSSSNSSPIDFTLASLLAFFENVNATSTMRQTLIIKTVAYVLGGNLINTSNTPRSPLGSSDPALVLLQKHDVLEVLFVLAQVFFGELGREALVPAAGFFSSAIAHGIPTRPEALVSDLHDDQDHLVMMPLTDPLERLHALLLGLCDSRYAAIFSYQISSPVRARAEGSLERSARDNRSGKLPAEESLVLAVEQATPDALTDSLSMGMPPYILDVLVLLLHYPHSHTELTPWRISGLFNTQLTKLIGTGIAGFEGDLNIRALLPQIFRDFCAIFDLPSDVLATYFASFYTNASPNSDVGSGGVAMRVAARDVLSGQSFRILLQPSVLVFLRQNASLLEWEFCRVSASHRFACPSASHLLFPIPTASMSRLPHISAHCAAAWMVDMLGVAPNRAEFMLRDFIALAQPRAHAGSMLTFSNFIVLAVRCCTEAGNGQTYSDYTQRLRDLMASITTRLSSIESEMDIPQLLSLYKALPASSTFTSSVKTALSRCALKFFDAQLPSPGSVAPFEGDLASTTLPPRPPLMFWDAPRFVQFCRIIGALDLIGGPGIAWRTFGVHLSTRGGKLRQGDEVIPPTPIIIDQATLTALLDTLTRLHHETPSRDQHSHPDAPWQCLLTCIMSYTDAKLTTSVPPLNEPVLLGDLFRYGGSRLSAALSRAQAWLRTAFDAVRGKESEPSIPKTCKFFTCHGLVKPHIASMLAARSLSTRQRPLSVDSLPQSLSFSEFVELFIRCAANVWGVVGAGTESTISADKFMNDFGAQNDTEISFSSTGKRNSYDNNDREILKSLAVTYCQHCEESQSTYAAAELPSIAGLGVWGVDYLTPYASTLKRAVEVTMTITSASAASASTAAEYGNRAESGRVENADVETNTGLTPSLLQKKLDARLGNCASTSAPRPGVETLNNRALSPAVKALAVTIAALGDSSDAHYSSDGDSRIPPARLDPATSTDIATQNTVSTASADPEPDRSLILQSILNEDNDLFYSNTLSQVTTSGADLPRRVLNPSHAEADMKAAPRSIDTPAQLIMASGPDALLDGTKEALWPVYATYCSCGDSLDPGKLSGPNLFTLLSKLNVLSDRTLLSDIGILLHQISAHTHSQSSIAIASGSQDDPFESPSLSFEEFLVFLCAFAQLRFEGVVSAPIFVNSSPPDEPPQTFIHAASAAGQDLESSTESLGNSSIDRVTAVTSVVPGSADGWFENWRRFMGSSSSFRRLLEESVLPILSRHALLAFPEDARHRDRYASVFSLEVLLAIEGSESAMRGVFDAARREQNDNHDVSSKIVDSLKRINLVPQVIGEEEVLQLVRDVLPAGSRKDSSRTPRVGQTKDEMQFPQWEWVMAVVAYQAVETAVQQSTTATNPKKIPSMVADVISSMAAATHEILHQS